MFYKWQWGGFLVGDRTSYGLGLVMDLDSQDISGEFTVNFFDESELDE